MKATDLQDRITQLHYDNQEAYATRGRIRAIMNGGPSGILALLGDQIKGFQEWQVPVPNLMSTGLEHLAQKIGRIPNLKVDFPNDKDNIMYDYAIQNVYKKNYIYEQYIFQYDTIKKT